MDVSGSEMIFEQVRKNGDVVVAGTPKLDIDLYLQNYSGSTRFERLEFIGTHSVALSVEALKAAVIEAKKGRDWNNYKSALDKLRSIAPDEPEAIYDIAWGESTTKRNLAETDRLEAQLKAYKNNLIKESVRMGNEDLGKHYEAIGDLTKAYEAYSRMRQDISMQRHIIDVSKHLISVAIRQKNWIAVQSNVQKMMAVHQSAEDERALAPYIKVCLGLINLGGANFWDAALAFLGVNSGVGTEFNDKVSPNDIAIYGGLCALASMDRENLQKRVLENTNFRTYLELEPHIRRAIAFFVNGRYSACLSILEDYRNDYLLDCRIGSLVPEIYVLIRSKSIVQYFVPFSCVTLDGLNAAFAPPGQSIEEELISMIQRGILEARIDAQKRLLLSVPSLPRATLQKETLDSARAYERELRHRIQRMNIIGADVEVRGAVKKGQGGGQLHPDDLFVHSRAGEHGLRPK
ncbi:MAG: hypothetical protein M1818_005566 [Claussenomyces sp. TS43310]|nr:MAG: hypothetical protein M1818_005566 [Claussenomyces sp. TS43310]